MSSSDSDFDDDDDALLQDVLYGRTQVPVISTTQAPPASPHIQYIPQPQPPPLPPQPQPIQPHQHSSTQSRQNILDDQVQARLFQADGEIATLRAQLQQLQNQKQKEVTALQESFNTFKQSSEGQVSLLKSTVQRLEDEKKFLNNELISTHALKRRKMAQVKPSPSDESIQHGDTVQKEVNNKETVLKIEPESSEPDIILKPVQKIVKLQNDSSLLIDQLWNHSIIGSKRTSFEYLKKICLDSDLELNSGLKVFKRTSISSSIVEFLMINKNNRLDKLIENFSLSLIQLIEKLLKLKSILSVPFLLSLIHCSISFRPAALTKSLVSQLLKRVSKITEGLSFLLDSNLDEDDLANYHEVPYQVMVLEKFIFISCLDLMERLVTVSTIFEPEFIKGIWHKHILSQLLLQSCLPENSERFKNIAQINVVYNVVEMLIASITEETFAFNETKLDESIITSLLKVFWIDIPLREDFMFYGLNRILGNNSDFHKIETIIPVENDYLNNYLVIMPQPIPLDMEPPKKVILEKNHEYHLCTLQIRVAQLLLELIITKETFDFLYDQEHFKSMIRMIGFEQNCIARFPRSKHVHMRIELIALLVRIIDYLTQDLREVNELIYTEQMYEIFVVFLRIAFGADSLSIEAHEMLTRIRTQPKYVNLPVFNKWCEPRARELNHINSYNANGETIATVESDFANGLEFPYESETVELARDILNRFVDHDEADNLYFNMNPEEEGSDQEMYYM